MHSVSACMAIVFFVVDFEPLRSSHSLATCFVLLQIQHRLFPSGLVLGPSGPLGSLTLTLVSHCRSSRLSSRIPRFGTPPLLSCAAKNNYCSAHFAVSSNFRVGLSLKNIFSSFEQVAKYCSLTNNSINAPNSFLIPLNSTYFIK